MTSIQEALNAACVGAGHNDAAGDPTPPIRVAIIADVGEFQARRWLRGEASPSGEALLKLMRGLPGFAVYLGFRPLKVKEPA